MSDDRRTTHIYLPNRGVELQKIVERLRPLSGSHSLLREVAQIIANQASSRVGPFTWVDLHPNAQLALCELVFRLTHGLLVKLDELVAPLRANPPDYDRAAFRIQFVLGAEPWVTELTNLMMNVEGYNDGLEK
jgi:hypothetical protein